MYTHFRTEFVRRSKASIMHRVTMTQFMFVVGALVVGIGMLSLPWWAAPFLIAVAYVAGYELRGEMVIIRLGMYGQAWARQLLGRPRLTSVAAGWEALRARE